MESDKIHRVWLPTHEFPEVEEPIGKEITHKCIHCEATFKSTRLSDIICRTEIPWPFVCTRPPPAQVNLESEQ